MSAATYSAEGTSAPSPCLRYASAGSRYKRAIARFLASRCSGLEGLPGLCFVAERQETPSERVLPGPNRGRSGLLYLRVELGHLRSERALIGAGIVQRREGGVAGYGLDMLHALGEPPRQALALRGLEARHAGPAQGEEHQSERGSDHRDEALLPDRELRGDDAERIPLDVLHGDIDFALDLANLVDFAYMLVIHPRLGSGLGDEAPGELGIAIAANELEGHVATKPQIAGMEHPPHAPLAEEFHVLIPVPGRDRKRWRPVVLAGSGG